MIIHSTHIGRLISDKTPYLLYDPKKDKQGRPERVIEKIKLDDTHTERPVKTGSKESLIKLEPVDDDGVDLHASISYHPEKLSASGASAPPVSKGPLSAPFAAAEALPVLANVPPTVQSQSSGRHLSGDAQSQKDVPSGTPHIVPLSVSPPVSSLPPTLASGQHQSKTQSQGKSQAQSQAKVQQWPQPQSRPTSSHLDMNDGFVNSIEANQHCKFQVPLLLHSDTNNYIAINPMLDRRTTIGLYHLSRLLDYNSNG